MKTTFSRALLFGVLVCVSSSPSPAAAAGFQITASVTSSNLNLKTTTVPAGRLAWFEGNRPDAITNLIQREALPAVQHDLSFAVQAPAAFFRAAMLDTNAFILNVERAPLASGGYFSVAITTEGIIKTWGGNYHGEFGNGLLPQNITNFGTHVACWTVGASVTTTNAGPGPVQQSSDTDWVSVAAGAFHTLALKADGSLWGWGDNSRGQLGVTTPGTNCSPVQIGAGQLWNAVFACGSSSLAIRRDGTLWGWGANGGSVLGLGPAYTNSNSVWAPTQAGTSSNWVKVVVLQEGTFSVGLQSDGSLWAWGDTDLPSYVRAAFTSTNVAIPLTTSPAPTGIPGPWVDVTVATPSPGLLALKADGSMWVDSGPTNGAANYYQLMAYISFVESQETDPASLYHMFVDAGVSSDAAFDLAMTYLFIPFHPWAASANFDFAVFASAYSDANLLHPYSSRNGWLMVRGNNALNRDGTIWIIGRTLYGGPYDYGMQQLDASTNWAYVSGGSAGAKADGSVWSWDGIANESVAWADDMVSLVTTQKWLRVKKTAADVVALDTHSNLWTWGQNYYAWPPSSGQLGLGDYRAHLTPTQISPAGPWLDFAASPCFTLAVRQGGELWAWGDYNSTGTNVATPQRLNPERPWRSVFAHLDHAYALAEDGTLWAMGDNASYNSGTGPVLGLNDTNHLVITSLQQLPGTNWAFVSPSGDCALALKTDGSLWGWGGSWYAPWMGTTNAPRPMTGYDFGLGYISSDLYLVPTAIPGHTWSSVSAEASELGFKEAYGGFGIETNGTLWAWGYENLWSQLGLEWLDQLYNTEYWACQGPGGASPLVFEGGEDGAHNTLQALQVGWDTRWKTVCSTGTELSLWGSSSANMDYSVTVYTLGLKMDGTLWVWGKSPFASVTNQRVYQTPVTHPFPGVPYPQVPAAIPAPQQVGTNRWSFADIEAAITTNGDLYMWGGNDAGQLLQPPPWLPSRVHGNIVCRLPPRGL